MKTIILLAILLFPGLAGAQRQEIRLRSGVNTDSITIRAARDSVPQRRHRGSTKRLGELPLVLPTDTVMPLLPNYRMPNALSVPGAPNTYKGNNGQGFDVYASPIDNMTILVPDSANRVSLRMAAPAPVKQKIIPVRIVPLKTPVGNTGRDVH